ncbi:MAG TPA: hypothetical protein VF774_04865 [Pseudoduganella sp.]|jgi:hypothetical protein
MLSNAARYCAAFQVPSQTARLIRAPSCASTLVIASCPGQALLSSCDTRIHNFCRASGFVSAGSHWPATRNEAAKKSGYWMFIAIDIMQPPDWPVAYSRCLSMA